MAPVVEGISTLVSVGPRFCFEEGVYRLSQVENAERGAGRAGLEKKKWGVPGKGKGGG